MRARHQRLGGLILAVTGEPQTTTNWAVGAEGERKLGAGLDGLADEGVISHDRLRPGTTANIDHLGVAASGVWVIDAKRYKGVVAKRDVGGWLSTDVRLFVGRRDCMKLVAAMSKQVAAVRKVLGADWADVPVRPMLCFVDAEWRWFAKPFELDGVIVTWPNAARALLVGAGPLAPEMVERIATRLDEELEPAS
ncbi:MAG: NERD domain-containing protein [Actinomycetota bacterium]|nr:NERD domain-containing protein [Actinomycetota bacterium]